MGHPEVIGGELDCAEAIDILTLCVRSPYVGSLTCRQSRSKTPRCLMASLRMKDGVPLDPGVCRAWRASVLTLISEPRLCVGAHAAEGPDDLHVEGVLVLILGVLQEGLQLHLHTLQQLATHTRGSAHTDTQ